NELNADLLNLNGNAVQAEEQEGAVQDTSWENNSVMKDITMDSEMNMFGFDSGFGSGCEYRSGHGSTCSASKGHNWPVAPRGNPDQDGHSEGTQYDLFEKDLTNFNHASFFKDATNNEPFKYTASLEEINFTRNSVDVTNDTIYSINNYDDLENVENFFPIYDGINFGKEVEVSFSTGADVFSGSPNDPSGKFIASDKNDKFSELLEEFQKCSI
ncbi:cyclin g-associated kinase, partial [Plasmodium cynomolgi strain B]